MLIEKLLMLQVLSMSALVLQIVEAGRLGIAGSPLSFDQLAITSWKTQLTKHDSESPLAMELLKIWCPHNRRSGIPGVLRKLIQTSFLVLILVR
jgi:hypothetical protein